MTSPIHIDGLSLRTLRTLRTQGLAAAQGHADAQNCLANMFYEGRGGPKDEAEARRLLVASRPRKEMLTHRATSLECTTSRKAEQSSRPRRSGRV